MKKLLLSLTLMSFFIGKAQNYSFESAQGFNIGNIAGQNGWGGTQAAYIGVISNEQANPGTQSLKITGNNGTVHNTLGGAISPTFSVTGSVVTVAFNAYFTPSTPAGDESDFFFSPQSPTESTINARLRFTFEGDIFVVDTDPSTLQLGYVETGASFTKNTWNTYRIELDFANSEARYFQNGTLIYTGGIVGGTKVGNLAITNDNYNSSAYFDGIQVLSGVLGTSDVKKLSYKMYPNPTSDFAVIETADKINSIEVFDFSGKKLNAPFSGNKVDLRSLPVGVYILNINTSKGIVTDRIVKK